MAEAAADPVEVIRAEALSPLPHGFLGRRGGVSRGAMASLNTGPGSGDDADAIGENRSRAAEAVLPGARLVSVYQVHSPDCVIVREPWSDDARPKADALATDRPGLLLGILTADCAPVLLADHEAGVVAAAHAGWRGAFADVTDRTVEAMESLGADRSRICAAIGPCIAQTNYEVDEAFHTRFVEADGQNDRFFVPGRAGHHQFDLEGYVAMRLETAGIGEIVQSGLDTYGDENRFFSFRRATHRSEPAYGRQISLIGLRAAQ